MRYTAIACQLVLALAWLVAASHKALDFGGFNDILRDQYKLPQLASYAAMFLPAFETSLGLAIVLKFHARAALWASVVLLAIFSMAIGYGLMQGELSSCGCLGTYMALTPGGSLARNLGLAALALFSLRHLPLVQEEPSGLKGWLVASACILAALTTGSSTQEPHFSEPGLNVGDGLEALALGIPNLGKEPTLLFAFKAECPKCWDGGAQVESFSQEKRLKIIGLTPSTEEALEVFRRKLEPSFEVHGISEETLELLAAQVPVFFFVKNGIVVSRIESNLQSLVVYKHFGGAWFENFLGTAAEE